MFFLTFLVLSIISIFSSTLYNYWLSNAYNPVLIYHLLDKDTTKKSLYFTISSIVVMCMSGFFFPFVLYLTFIQLKNYISNRTTNERYSRKTKVRKGSKNGARTASSVVSADSSSLLSTTSTMVCEDVIHDYADAEDFSDKKCPCIFNCAVMCFSKKIPSQKEIYYVMLSKKSNQFLTSSNPLNDSNYITEDTHGDDDTARSSRRGSKTRNNTVMVNKIKDVEKVDKKSGHRGSVAEREQIIH